MYKLSWAALRQLEALRESVAYTLMEGAVDCGNKMDPEFYCNWLRKQGIEPVIMRYKEGWDRRSSVRCSMDDFLEKQGLDLHRYVKASTYSRFIEEDAGVHRSGAGWDSLPNFIISSAFVRLLGAMEKFELDVLKSLLYYRPKGRAEKLPMEVIEADLNIATELPNEDGDYEMPLIWTWIKKQAENNIERRKIFKKIYGIECQPKSFASKSKSAINKYYNNLYENRNSIAHGRNRVEIILSDYCMAEVFVMTLIDDIANKCLERYALAV